MNLCLLCSAPCPWDRGLCEPCLTDCPRIGAACRRCGNPLARTVLCGRCAARPPPFTRVISPFRYRYPVDALIRDFKYRDRLACVRFFGAALAAEVRARGAARPDCALPVPLHWRRCAERGFNQSLEIARIAGELLQIPVNRHCLQRHRPTLAQAGLRAAARRRNVRGAFVVSRGVSGKRVAIVDDVMTTGATTRELSRALLAAGAAEVEIWAVALAN